MISPVRWVLVLGLILIGMGPLLWWVLSDELRATPRGAWVDFAYIGGSMLVAAGWVAVGAGLRPKGSLWLGAGLAVMAYMSVGLVIVVAIGADVPDVSHGGLSEIGSFVLFSVLWPAYTSLAFGLFGVSFD